MKILKINKIIMKNFYSTKTIEEYSKVLDIEFIKINKNEILQFKTKVKKHENYSNKLRAFFYISVASQMDLAWHSSRDYKIEIFCCFYYCHYYRISVSHVDSQE